MSVDTRELYPDALADEDFEFLKAIAKSLQEKLAYFRIDLPDGAFLTNSESEIKMAGIDQIYEAHNKIMELDAQNPHMLIMPTMQFSKRIKIGEIFGMPVYVDPTCPKDRFVIQQHIVQPGDEDATEP